MKIRNAVALKRSDSEDVDSLSLCQLERIAVIGSGGFGNVELVKYYDKVYALKIMEITHIKKMNQKNHILSERDIVMNLDSDFIVKAYKAFKDSQRLYMLMEPCLGGELFCVLRQYSRFDNKTARYYVAAAMEALEYLHRRSIVYRDLKPENMLLDRDGYPKLCDFGFAKCIRNEGVTYTFCGTVEYVAPEIVLNKGHDMAVDNWALGVFAYELLTGAPPFNGHGDPMKAYTAILKGVEGLVWPKYMSKEAVNIIMNFCKEEPALRLGYGNMNAARAHPWFENFDFESFSNLQMAPPIVRPVASPVDTTNFSPCKQSFSDEFEFGDETSWDSDF